MKPLLSLLAMNLVAISAMAQNSGDNVGNSTGLYIFRALPIVIVFVALFFVYRYVNRKKAKK